MQDYMVKQGVISYACKQLELESDATNPPISPKSSPIKIPQILPLLNNIKQQQQKCQLTTHKLINAKKIYKPIQKQYKNQLQHQIQLNLEQNLIDKDIQVQNELVKIHKNIPLNMKDMQNIIIALQEYLRKLYIH